MKSYIIWFNECHKSCLAGGGSWIKSVSYLPFLFFLTTSPKNSYQLIPALCVAIRYLSLMILLLF